MGGCWRSPRGSRTNILEGIFSNKKCIKPYDQGSVEGSAGQVFALCPQFLLRFFRRCSQGCTQGVRRGVRRCSQVSVVSFTVFPQVFAGCSQVFAGVRRCPQVSADVRSVHIFFYSLRTQRPLPRSVTPPLELY